MTTYHYHLEIDDEEFILLKRLLREYIETTTDDGEIQLAKSIIGKGCENMEQMSGLF